MKSTEVVSSFLKKYDLSNRVMAKLLDLNPSSVNNWRRGAQDISQKNIDHINNISKLLDTLIEESNMNNTVLISLILALKNTPLWQDWDTAKEIILGKNRKSNGPLYEDFVKNNLGKLDNGLKLSTLTNQQSCFDFLAEDSDGNIKAIETKISEVRVEVIGQVLHQISRLEKILDRPFEVIVVAPSFSKSFIDTLKTLPQNITTRSLSVMFSE